MSVLYLASRRDLNWSLKLIIFHLACLLASFRPATPEERDSHATVMRTDGADGSSGAGSSVPRCRSRRAGTRWASGSSTTYPRPASPAPPAPRADARARPRRGPEASDAGGRAERDAPRGRVRGPLQSRRHRPSGAPGSSAMRERPARRPPASAPPPAARPSPRPAPRRPAAAAHLRRSTSGGTRSRCADGEGGARRTARPLPRHPAAGRTPKPEQGGTNGSTARQVLAR